MSFNAVLFILIFLSCGFFTFGSTVKAGDERKEKSGPYVSVIKQFRKCEKLLEPSSKYPVGYLTCETTNSTIKGNLTVLRNITNVHMSIQDFYYEDGHWQITFNARNINCRMKWLAILMHSLGFSFDKKNCGMLKGSYLFDADINTLDHVAMPTREYGQMLRHVEVQSKDGPVVCLELVCDMIPLK